MIEKTRTELKKRGELLVSGSIAYDRIMNFPGKFKDHILPDMIHILNVCFVISELKEGFGGTAGNIAYNLALLGEKPKVLGVAGEDFGKYEKWLHESKVDISLVKVSKKELTAGAYIVTDQDDNQITAFYPGPKNKKYYEIARKIKNARLAIISPDDTERMVNYAKIYKANKVPYIFDPGQQTTALTATELKQAINGSYCLIGNDYEIQLILNKLKIKQEKLESMTDILVITKGGKGSEFYFNGKLTKVPSAKPKNTSDPTGAGDAFRAGLIKGLLEGWSLEKIGRLAGTVAVYTVEKYGTQTHNFTRTSLTKRFRDNFGMKYKFRI